MKKFLSYFSSLGKLKKIFAYGDRIRPARDWYIILTTAAVLLVIGIGWNVFLFNELENGKTIGGAIVTAPHEVVGSSVNSVQAVFQKRATEENNYQSTYHFVDPSVPGS